MTHAELLALLLPPGSYDASEPRLSAELAAEGSALDQAQGDASKVLAGITPYDSAEMLADWERVYGLPDPLLGPNQTLQQRMAALIQRINEVGGLSREYFIFVALNLGFSINITEFQPFRAGRSQAGQPVYGEAWVFTWRISAAESTIFRFRAGRSAAGEPLAKWGNELLESVLRRLAPAHTVLQFAYGGDPSLLLDEEGDGFLMDEDNDYLDFS
ncbi:YmfQ family protein [Cupriavidus basilensis]|uniref:YmfQ family protein n=1 Tax=Cupriavidus basilensis TaxID=68895 RepID=UPI0039F6CB73